MTSVASRSVRICGARHESGRAAVRIEDGVENTRNETGFRAAARIALPCSGGTARFGPILAGGAGVVSAK